jgi:molybdate transport system substrate-binding protein
MRSVLALVLLLSVVAAQAAEVRVAVAANFLGTLQKLAPMYERASGNMLVLSSGASGAFYAQIVNGAPFDVFLSADVERAERLEQDGLTVPGTRFVYARGVPVLWSPRAGLVDGEGKVLRQGRFRHIAIADPAVAPYGVAAEEVLRALGVLDALDAGRRIARGKSIGQTYAHIATGAAELGFVALSQLQGESGIRGSYWIPPAALYTPIAQQAVVLRRAADVAAARDFLAWLRSDEARAVIRGDGYQLD